MSNKLAYYLRRTAAVHVTVDLEQVSSLLGVQRARELADFVIGEHEIQTRANRRRSAIPKDKRVSKNTLAQYRLSKLLEAINEVVPPDNAKPKFNATPNPELTPEKTVVKLMQKGILDDKGQIQT